MIICSAQEGLKEGNLEKFNVLSRLKIQFFQVLWPVLGLVLRSKRTQFKDHLDWKRKCQKISTQYHSEPKVQPVHLHPHRAFQPIQVLSQLFLFTHGHVAICA